jgi:hypothetical protein
MNLYDIKRRENEEFSDYHIRLFDDMPIHGLDSDEVAEILNKEHGVNYTESKWRKDYASYRKWRDYILSKVDDTPVIKYKESTEIKKDGSQSSDKLVKMNEQQSKDVDFLLDAHGFDTTKWELLSARNNIWNVSAGDNPNKTLYSSRITVKPKTNGFDWDKIISNAIKNIKPVPLDVSPTRGEGWGLLEIPLFDMHFGIADLEYYAPTYNKITKRIKGSAWDTILFIVGQDLIHNDGFRGKTTSGTIIQPIDMEKAFNDALSFYVGLIQLASKHSKTVKVIFSSGNHDETIGYGFVRTLKATFPTIDFDHELKTRKGFSWNKIFIATTHGDKGHARMVRNVMDEFRNEILAASVAEIHSGHLHSEKSKDDFGIVSRTLGTRAITDDWHYEQGFVGAMKRFQIFEYSSDALEGIYYV